MRGTPGRISIAVAMAALATLATPPRTLACSGPPRTFDEVLAGSALIVEGDVEAVLLDGLAYRLAVDEVFKGPSTGTDVRIGPETAPSGRGCEISLSEGDHVIIGVVDVAGGLNSLATAVWFVAPDGSLSSPGSLWEMAFGAEDLRRMLRSALPDTAQQAVPRGGSGALYVLLSFMALAVLASVVSSRTIVRRRNR